MKKESFDEKVELSCEVVGWMCWGWGSGLSLSWFTHMSVSRDCLPKGMLLGYLGQFEWHGHLYVGLGCVGLCCLGGGGFWLVKDL
jgi:hypothetical protein